MNLGEKIGGVMGAQANAAPVIIKKKKVIAGGGHHGGAWKVAYADFVTAMMAFFMLMWLLNATTEKQRKGLADYFSPTIAVARVSGGGSGAFGGDSVFSEMTMARSGTGATSLRPTSQDKSSGASTGDDSETQALKSLEAEFQGLGGESTMMDNAKRHIITRVTDEGLVIEIFALPGIPLFDANNAPTDMLVELAGIVSRASALVTNPVAVEGHSASQPIVRANNQVWDTSTQRAMTLRLLLEKSGLDSSRMARVTGHADKDHVDDNPMAVRNNRFEIILLRSNL